jgi:hypothetical protein
MGKQYIKILLFIILHFLIAQADWKFQKRYILLLQKAEILQVVEDLLNRFLRVFRFLSASNDQFP